MQTNFINCNPRQQQIDLKKIKRLWRNSCCHSEHDEGILKNLVFWSYLVKQIKSRVATTRIH